MHDISLGNSIRDYLTGEDVEETTYEDLRQGLARMLVEELGYPKERITPRLRVVFPINGQDYCRLMDFGVYSDAGKLLLVILFTPGDVVSYERECLCAARLAPGGPAPLAAITDTQEAVLLSTASNERLERGARAIPHWDQLLELAEAHPPPDVLQERREKEARILYTYSEYLYGCCSAAECTVEGKGGRWAEQERE